MSHPVVADVEPFEKAADPEDCACDLNAAVDGENDVSYPVNEAQDCKPVLRCPRTLASEYLCKSQQSGDRKSATHGNRQQEPDDKSMNRNPKQHQKRTGLRAKHRAF